MSRGTNVPLPVVFGVDVLSVAQAYSGSWLVTHTGPNTEPELVAWAYQFGDALNDAKRIAASLPCAVVEAPTSFGRIHVHIVNERYEVLHESASGESFASLASFQLDAYEQAVEYAKSQLGQYSPCVIGEVVPWAF